MRTISLEEIKQIELNMLKYLDKICRENNIHYYIVGGTLLGAVRHGGFIPWDDDIDVGMPRKEFIKLQKIFEKDNSYYELHFYDNVKNYGYPFPKLVDTRTTLIDYKLGNGREETSVFIDIFLGDGMANNRYWALMRFYFLRIFKRAVFLSKRKFMMESIWKTIIFALPWILCHLIGPGRINRMYNNLCSKKDFYSTDIIAHVGGSYGKRELFDREVFEKSIDLRFEDASFKAPAEYDVLLTKLYGDYRKLPPKEKQVSNHSSEEWWND